MTIPALRQFGRRLAGTRTAMLSALLLFLSILGTAPLQAEEGAKPVLVAGATGRTGRLVVQELKSQGYPVRVLVRDAASAKSLLGDGIEVVEGDVRRAGTLKPAVTGIGAVISALGSGRKDPANGPEQVDYEGIRNLAEVAAAAGAGQFVLVSSAGVTQENHPLNKMFNNVLLWKAKGEAAVQGSGIPYTIIRPGGLTDKAGGEVAVRMEQGDRGTGFIPRADVARVAVAALKAPNARNKVFELYSGTGAPASDWDALFAALKPAP